MFDLVRRARWLGLVALLVGLVVGPAVSPAAAADIKPLAASCFASSCTGLDPSATNCNADAETHGDVTSLEGIRVRLRWSPTCRAAWARIDNGIPGDRVRVENTAGQNFPATISSGSSVYTRMVNDLDPLRAWACVRAVDTNRLTCTSPPW